MRTGHGAEEFKYHSRDGVAADRIAGDLGEAVDWILSRTGGGSSGE